MTAGGEEPRAPGHAPSSDGGLWPRRGADLEDMLDPSAIPPVPTPETDERLRIPDVLRSGPKTSAPRRGKDPESGILGIAAAWAVAFDFIFVVLAGCLVGYFVGKSYGNQAGWVLGGMALGLSLGIWRLVSKTQAQEREEQRRKAAQREAEPGNR